MRLLQKQEITFHNKKYEFKVKPYRLIVEDSDGTVFWQAEIFSYCDCFAYEREFLFWGERLGQIHYVDFNNKGTPAEFFISKEAEQFYKEKSGTYLTWDSKLRAHSLSDYDNLPELHISNQICSKLAISAMTSNGQAVVIGDLSGRIAVFDITKQAIVKNRQVPGPVADLQISDGKLLIDYAAVDRDVDSPDSIKNFTPLTRLEYDFASFSEN